MQRRPARRVASSALPALVLVLSVLLFGCSSSGGQPTTQPEVTLDPARWAAIIEDLSTRGVEASSARAVRAEAVTWNDGSLGCPEPGKVYTQAIVEGYQVIVEVGEQQFDYHFDSGDGLLLCE